MEFWDTGEKRYEKKEGKWVLKHAFEEAPATKAIQKKWKEHSLDGSVIECVTEVDVHIDTEYYDSSDEPVKEAFMKPLTCIDHLPYLVRLETYEPPLDECSSR